MMKLKNKKTGEIWDIGKVLTNDYPSYETLKEINEEWEDYEEPKVYWYINDLDGEPMKCDWRNCGKQNFTRWGEYRKQIGNYFNTQEEAEKAVEKLKAWKRLKDKGFKFIGVRSIGKVIDFDMPEQYHRVCFGEVIDTEDKLEFFNDLMMVFGGDNED